MRIGKSFTKICLQKKLTISITSSKLTNDGKIRALFENYASGSSSWSPTWFTHPRRHNREEVRAYLDNTSSTDVLVATIAKLVDKEDKPNSSLKRRLAYIENKINYKKHLDTDKKTVDKIYESYTPKTKHSKTFIN